MFPAADYTPPNLSHFESRDYWFAGALEELQTGWLGRWLDTYGSTSNPLQAISINSSLSKQIRSSRGAGVRDRESERYELRDPEHELQREQSGREPGRRAGRVGQRGAAALAFDLRRDRRGVEPSAGAERRLGWFRLPGEL